MLCTEKLNIFVQAVKRQDGSTFNIYSTSFSGKDKDTDLTINKSMDVFFVGEEWTKERLAKLKAGHYYKADLKKGYISVRAYVGKDGLSNTKHVLLVQEITFLEEHPIKQKPETSALDI